MTSLSNRTDLAEGKSIGLAMFLYGLCFLIELAAPGGGALRKSFGSVVIDMSTMADGGAVDDWNTLVVSAGVVWGGVVARGMRGESTVALVMEQQQYTQTPTACLFLHLLLFSIILLSSVTASSQA